MRHAVLVAVRALEDKVVQEAMACTLEVMYEAELLDSSYGYRLGRSAHQEHDGVGKESMWKPIGV